MKLEEQLATQIRSVLSKIDEESELRNPNDETNNEDTNAD
jgi:hypothetical protein